MTNSGSLRSSGISDRPDKNLAIADAWGKAVMAEEAVELKYRAERDHEWLMATFGYEVAWASRNADWLEQKARLDGLLDYDPEDVGYWEAMEAIETASMAAYEARRTADQLLAWGHQELQGWV